MDDRIVTKQKARIERFEELSGQKTNAPVGKLEIEAGATRLGRKIIELDRIHFGYAETALIRDFSYNLLKNDRLGIVGPNGSGKSTLLNLIAGRLSPTQGSVEIGQTVKIGYFSQESSEMDESLRVIEYIREEANYITTLDGTDISASQMLERFLFLPQVQWLPIAKLSGGERRRLFLLRILMGAPNVLLLDEPTNDLDVQTLTVLEDYLDDFPGAVVVVSHDRYFLDRVVDKLFAFEGDGVVTQYVGGYSDYQEKKALQTSPQEGRPAKQAVDKPVAAPQSRPLRKFSFNEQREYDTIEAVIAGVEAELQAVAAEIDAAGADFSLLQQLMARQAGLNAKLEGLMERWAYLEELSESIREQNKPD